MKHIPIGLIGLILAGAVAACLASQQVYGQRNAPANDPLAMWRKTSPGMSTNAALAFYRLQNSSPSPDKFHPRFQAGARNNISSAYSPLTRRNVNSSGLVGGYYPLSSRPANSKPFENVRPAPTAFERYWRLLLVGQQDPETGIIVWSLP